ncbi:MAG TPA: FAD-dependent monooxygenase [Gallionellaceae bacterium]|nr:FAD-dependent monooxygenase [Gallionellaceae bacterium]
MTAICDIAIIGGGPVGAALALALRDSGLQISVLEARKSKDANADPRALALSYGSRLLLARLGVWQDMSQVSSIRTIHISQRDSFGRTQLDAAGMNVPDLGYVLPYPVLQAALQHSLETGNVDLRYGATVTKLESNLDGADIAYQHDGSEHHLHARLVVVADGGKLLETSHPAEVRDYGQSAIIAHVTCSHPRTNTAFERFTADGPLALLPYQDGYELVWTVPHTAVDAMLLWDDATLLAQLHQHFGDRVGSFLSAGARSSFPLRLRRAPATTLPHTVLIGNAAQTLHPVAGQGFNMGLRDACELAQEILRSTAETLGSDAMLSNYRKSRSLDRNAGIRFTDGLVRLFSNDLPLASATRAASLSLLDCLPGMKKFVAKRMMFGVNG